LRHIIRTDKVLNVPNPIGRTANEGAAGRAARSRTYATERQRTLRWARIAKLVIQRRTTLEVTQQELADRAKTSYSAISRLESGRHATHLDTLHRVFAALDADLLLGYEPHTATSVNKERERELVAV
jgi:DNA-binding XRE family transcriptional regulator